MKSVKKILLAVLMCTLALPVVASQQGGPRVSKLSLLALGGAAAAAGFGYWYNHYRQRKIQEHFADALFLCRPVADIKNILTSNPKVIESRLACLSTAISWSGVRGMKESYIFDVVRLLLKAGADVNALNIYGETALLLAAKGGYRNVVRLLLDADADVRQTCRRNHTSLDYALEYGHAAVACLLMDRGAEFTDNVPTEVILGSALRKNNIDMMRLLLDKGVSPNFYASFGPTTGRRTVLQEAINRGASYEMLDLLWQRGAHFDDGDTVHKALLYCCGFIVLAPHVIKFLLDHGANPNATGVFGDTPLMRLAKNHGVEEVVEVCKLLVQHGAQIGATDAYLQRAIYAISSREYLEEANEFFDQFSGWDQEDVDQLFQKLIGMQQFLKPYQDQIRTGIQTLPGVESINNLVADYLLGYEGTVRAHKELKQEQQERDDHKELGVQAARDAAEVARRRFNLE